VVTRAGLTPRARAAFLLHDVFELEFDEVAGMLERSEAAVRQLASRAREHVRAGRPRFAASSDAGARLIEAFLAASAAGDPAALARLLADDAVLYADGGGKRSAALNPIAGRDKIVRFFAGIARKGGGAAGWTQVRRVAINGLPGFVATGPDGIETLALEIAGDRIVALYSVRNPDKLRHLS
jgi:RNA polymerase sigma-70 factor (ECF subfamily)